LKALTLQLPPHGKRDVTFKLDAKEEKNARAHDSGPAFAQVGCKAARPAMKNF
jgi:hypothetical protein